VRNQLDRKCKGTLTLIIQLEFFLLELEQVLLQLYADSVERLDLCCNFRDLVAHQCLWERIRQSTGRKGAKERTLFT